MAMALSSLRCHRVARVARVAVPLRSILPRGAQLAHRRCLSIQVALLALCAVLFPSTVLLKVDPQYPGTAVERLQGIHLRVKTLSKEELSGDWQEVRRRLLWAGGLRDLPDVPPGQGCTAHSFNDDTHCDLTAMLGEVSHNQNDGNIEGIATGNLLGPGIQVASLPELGPGGSWSTCINGCNFEPPQDVAHVQFRSRVAFKLVWCPPVFKKFVLVDDEGEYLAHGEPTGELPNEFWRKRNYELVRGGRYARVAESFKEE
mmetsp:Transcript_14172/g.31396  ORF Transcript_14172/g.31396 Transcript_14172/m.31396 type:complete len:259 (+) Transcript_14172:48-824(+)